MDPLGAHPAIVNSASLQHWHETEVPDYDIMVDDPNNMRKSPFPWRDDINKKIVLWSGDLTLLNTEAIVNSTNEAMTDRTPLTERIFNMAGPQLRYEVQTQIKNCKTGEAKLTKGYELAARYVIHTVGPRYNLKYKTAAESALFNSYRSVLQILREKNITSLGLPCIHSMRRGYPNYEGAHIAIRAVRRFLENHGPQIEHIIFVVVSEDEDVYLNLMPLYFPRSQSEEDFSAYHLPYDVGNQEGEPVVPERQIRITGKPVFSYQSSNTTPDPLDESVNISEAFETSVAVGAHAFAKMEGDIDKQRRVRLQRGPGTSVNMVANQKRYDHWLKRSKEEDLTSVAQLRCLYQSGFDKYKRPVVVFVGKYFHKDRVSLEKAAMYFIHLMDQIVSQPFVIVYLHTDTERDNQPEMNFIKEIYNLVDQRYKRNLKAFYILHPTFWSKVMVWFMTTFMLGDMKDKVTNILGLEYLYSRVPADQLDLPDFVLEYDMRVNGTRYYNPDEDQAIGSL